MVRAGLCVALVLATLGLVAADTLPRLFPSRVSFVPPSSSSSSSSSFPSSSHSFKAHHHNHHHHPHHHHHHHSFQSRHSSPFHSYASYQHSSAKYPSSSSKSSPSSPSSSRQQPSHQTNSKYQPSYANQLPSSASSSSLKPSPSYQASSHPTHGNSPSSSSYDPNANHQSPSYSYVSYGSSPAASSSSPTHHTPQPAPLMMKTARFVVVSEGMYDHAQHIHARERIKEEAMQVRRPYFKAGNTTSTQVFLGNTVTLDCTVHDVTNESVSWMRSRDDVLELITWDSNTYAKDDRYALVTERGDRWHRWQLVIRRTRADDQGQYRCQVSTQPPLVLVVTLNVTVPVARVVDERGTKVHEKHYNSGSMIELKCIVEQVPFPHGPVTWRRGSTVLTYNTSRGGISVKGNEAGGYIRSRLYVADATPHDSGFYSCWYKNITSDTVTVHVIAGENSAAMQHDGLPGSGGNVSGGPARPYPSLTLPSFLLLVTMATWVLASPSSVAFSFSLSKFNTSSSTTSSSFPCFSKSSATETNCVWVEQTRALWHQEETKTVIASR